MADYSLIQEIKERLDVVSVIGRYVPLKKTGSSYRGLCPFHSEKTPSFHVFPQTGTWKCFGCGAGGDIFTFIEKRENLPFPDVLRMLAQEAGVALRPVKSETQNARQRLLDLHAQAAAFFHQNLLTRAEGQRARDYLARRGLDQTTIEQFQLGYALDGWEHLIRHLQHQGYTLDEILQAGLAIARETGGAYDRFRHRVIIPIRDPQGRIIAFGGRILGEGEPKYLNSPQTPLFDKSQVVFGLDMAKRAIRARDQVVLVEGYMDVISAHQRGFKNVVAAMGTSITPQQIRLLSRYSRNFVFALDADAAGARATFRGVLLVQETLAEPGMVATSARGLQPDRQLFADVRIALMPPGEDPDDVLRQDPHRWQELIKNATPVVDYMIERVRQEHDLATATGKAQFVAHLLPTLGKIGNPIQRRHYIGRVAALAQVREQDVEEALAQFLRDQRRQNARRHRSTSTSPPPFEPPQPPPGVTYADEPPPSAPLATPPLEQGQEPAPLPPRAIEIGLEEHLLAVILLDHSHLLPWLDEELTQLEMIPLYEEDFANALNRAVFEALQDYLIEEPSAPLIDFLTETDTLIADHAQFLLHYAHRFQKEKPKYIKDHHLRRDVITSLLRLRLERLKKHAQYLEIALKDDPSSEALAHLTQLLNERKHLERALLRYSHTARWLRHSQAHFAS